MVWGAGAGVPYYYYLEARVRKTGVGDDGCPDKILSYSSPELSDVTEISGPACLKFKELQIT